MFPSSIQKEKRSRRMLKLTQTQRRVLAELAWNCRASVSEIAERVGGRQHVVRRLMQSLATELQLVPFCFTNAFRLGETPYRIYFSITNGDRARVKELREYLTALPDAHWFSVLYGAYQFGLSVRKPDIIALQSLLLEIDSRFGSLIQKKTVSAVTRFSHFVPWPAHVGSSPRKSFEYRCEDSRQVLDDVDRCVLGLLRDEPLITVRTLGQKMGLSASTAAYRIDKLLRSGVIIGFGYMFENRLVGQEAFLIHVATKGLSGHGFERFFKFAQDHPRVTWVAKTLGEWDIEIEVVLEDVFELDEIIQELCTAGRGSVEDVMVHTWGKTFKM